jgi:hypothetical protein
VGYKFFEPIEKKHAREGVLAGKKTLPTVRGEGQGDQTPIPTKNGEREEKGKKAFNQYLVLRSKFFRFNGFMH